MAMSELLTRRKFIYYSGVFVGSLTLVACGGGGGGSTPDAQNGPGGNDTQASPHIIYRLSSRGRKVSQAAKKHNANKRFSTASAAEGNRAHPGDRSRVVQLIVSEAEFNRLFDTGKVEVADLRKF
jgi:hypothetical protein